MQLEEFFDFLYGNESGYVYSPTKEPKSSHWEQHFFKWPEEKVQLIDHIRLVTVTHEVYHSPALFKVPSAEKDAFRGTQFVWAEFDGSAPQHLAADIPQPSFRLQSSDEGYEHWYWKLDHFSNDSSLIEDVSQRIAYNLDADMSCWNSNRVLRPPGTKHHDSGKYTVPVQWSGHSTPVGAFTVLKELPFRMLHEGDIKSIPDPLKVVNKYTFKDEDLDFFRTKEIKRGTGKGRSAALTKLGHICMEMGMSNAESLSIISNADSRWGKFVGRKDRKERLLGIINYCRARHPISPVEEDIKDPLRVYTYEEFVTSPITMEWVIEGLLHKKGMASLSGPPDVGKSQLSLRFAEKLAKGEKFLKWDMPKPMKTMFVSMEMEHESLHHVMTQIMTIEGHELLRDNMLIMPIGSSIHLNSKIAQHKLNKKIEEFQPDGIIFDSLGKAIADEISSDKIIFETFEYVDRTLRGEYGSFVWFVHHPRKGQIGNKRPDDIDDLYGSRYISAALTTAIGLWPGDGSIDVRCLKLRMAGKFSPFQIRRTDQVDFEVVSQSAPKISPTGKDRGVFGALGD